MWINRVRGIACTVSAYLCVHARGHSRIYSNLLKLCGCAQGEEYILQMQIREESIRSSLACHGILWFFAKHSVQLNHNRNEKTPTAVYLCQSIFYGLRANHDAPFRRRHNLPSKGCITSRQSAECYVIGGELDGQCTPVHLVLTAGMISL